MFQTNLLLPAALAIAFAFTSCGRKTEAPAAPPVVEVGTIEVKAQPVTLSRELPGRTSAFRIAEVRARVSGIVLKRHFTEGTDVQKGDLLYQIDPAPYQATLDSAEATLARAEAGAKVARLQEQRLNKLLKSRTISQQEYDAVLAELNAAEADLAAGRAAVDAAAINLEYTKVTSPISGRIGLSEVTEGAYVQAAAATLMATVQQLDPIYVDLTQSSSEVLELRRALAEGRLTATDAGDAKVTLLLEGTGPYAEEGTLQFSDVTVDPSTSSITLRAIFPNPNNELLPGMFVRARLEEGSAPDAILVPQLGVTRDTRGEPIAYVVGSEGTVELRSLKVARALGNQWLVTEGLEAGDRLIVQNLQRIGPGAPVTAIPATNVPEATR